MLTKRNNHTIVHVDKRKLTRTFNRKLVLGRRPYEAKYSPRPSFAQIATQWRPRRYEGSVLQTSRRGRSGRVSTLKTPSKSLAHCCRRMRSISSVFILQSQKTTFLSRSTSITFSNSA